MTSVLVEEQQQQQYVTHLFFFFMKAFSGLVAYYELSLILYGVSVWTHSQNRLLLQNIANSHMMHICT